MAKEKTFAASLDIEAFTAEELGCTTSGTCDAIPESDKDAYLAIQENIKNAAASRVAANVQRAMAEGPGLEAGAPVIAGYEYVDILSVSPRKPTLSPPWINLPHKIVAGNETVVHRAILLINPLPGPLGTPTGRHVLGSRPYRITFSLMNVTSAIAGPSFTINGTFPALAPVVSTYDWPITLPDPGPNPVIYELNVTFDCLDPEQPYAAFATRWWDLDTDPGWPWFIFNPPVPTLPPVPPVFPGYRVQTPLRYLLYTE